MYVNEEQLEKIIAIERNCAGRVRCVTRIDISRTLSFRDGATLNAEVPNLTRPSYLRHEGQLSK